jgi:hypothetical protein
MVKDYDLPPGLCLGSAGQIRDQGADMPGRTNARTKGSWPMSPREEQPGYSHRRSRGIIPHKYQAWANEGKSRSLNQGHALLRLNMDLKQRVPGLIGVVFFIPSRASRFVPAQRKSHVLGRRLAVKDDEVKRHRVVSKRRHQRMD